jgi:murein L,D-transpeptidase YcbB/YkuD
MTAHRWFAATACPGDYLYSKFDDIAAAVNKKLNPVAEKPVEQTSLYRVRTSWDNAASQVGAYSSLENAKEACDKAGQGYEVYDAKGKAVYPQSKKTDPVLRKGAKGPEVKEMQTLLNNLGFPCEPDGSFGSATHAEVLAFQKDRNLEKDGVCGPKTWAALRAFTPYKVKVTADKLNVRSGAGTSNKIVA